MYTKIITQTFKKSNFKYSHLFLSKKDFVIQYAYPNKLSPDAYFNIGAFDYLFTDCCLNFVETIAHTPDCLNINWLAWVIFYLLPNVSDMAHNDVVIT